MESSALMLSCFTEQFSILLLALSHVLLILSSVIDVGSTFHGLLAYQGRLRKSIRSLTISLCFVVSAQNNRILIKCIVGTNIFLGFELLHVVDLGARDLWLIFNRAFANFLINDDLIYGILNCFSFACHLLEIISFICVLVALNCSFISAGVVDVVVANGTGAHLFSDHS